MLSGLMDHLVEHGYGTGLLSRTREQARKAQGQGISAPEDILKHPDNQ